MEVVGAVFLKIFSKEEKIKVTKPC